MVPQRDKALLDELNKQNSNDELRVKFATQANEVGNHIKAKMEVMDLPRQSHQKPNVVFMWFISAQM